MFARYVAESIRRAPRRKAMTVAAIAMGTAVATAMLGVMLDIGDKVNLELRSMGANILVTPKARAAGLTVGGISATPLSADDYIPENSVQKIKTIFWANNITGFAPSLTVQTRVNGAEIPVRVCLVQLPVQTRPACGRLGAESGMASHRPAFTR